MASGRRPRRSGGRKQESEDEAAGEAELIWLREEPAARRPAHTRGAIAEAAMEIADTEGFQAVSMRRVAEKLGAGTMTIYHYIRSKRELVALMTDAVIGETLVPEDELVEGDWRAALRQIAIRTRETFKRHRWALDRLDTGQPVPNSLRSFEQAMRACASLDIPAEAKFELITFLDDYVYGFALREAREIADQRRGWPPEVLEFVKRRIESEEYPQLRRFFGEDVESGLERAGELFLGEGRFERGLDRLLDGIQAGLDEGSG